MNKVSKWFGRLADGIDKASFALATIAIILIAVSVIWEVVNRYVFGSPTRWVTEVSGYLLATGLFMGLGPIYRHNGHVRMSTVLDAVKPSTAYVLYLLTDLIVLAFALVLAWETGQLTMNAYDFNWKSSTLLEAPLYIPQLAMTVGAIVFILEVVATALARTPNNPTATQGRQAC